jgi:hypothetical protein
LSLSIVKLIERQENTTVDHIRGLRPLSLVSGCASFSFSSYPNRPDSAIVTSLPTLAKLLPGVQSVDVWRVREKESKREREREKLTEKGTDTYTLAR